LTATGVERIEGDQGKVTGVRDSHNVIHAAGLVVMAVGAVPNIGLAEPLGLSSGQGIHVDSCGRTANGAMFAAGDCAFGTNLFAGREMRLESVQNATDLGKAAGAAIAGKTMPNLSVPWFWSDQFDMKLQMVGFSQDAQQEVVRGSLEEGKFSVFYLRDERVVAIESVNAVSDHVFGRKLLAVDHRVSATMLADPAFNPRDLIASKAAAA
jgi:3-phenylpropionate/trans-cinnamate dioxygenase ferredoxin reductase subunit